MVCSSDDFSDQPVPLSLLSPSNRAAVGHKANVLLLLLVQQVHYFSQCIVGNNEFHCVGYTNFPKHSDSTNHYIVDY